LRPDDEAALAAPLRSSKPDESESGRLHGSKKNSLFLLIFLIFGGLGSYVFAGSLVMTLLAAAIYTKMYFALLT